MMMMLKKNHSSHGTDYMVVKMAEEDQPKEMFTKWFNVDRPWVVSKNQLYGNGDYESVHNIKNFFSTICEDMYDIVGAECRLTSRESEVFSEASPIDTGDVLHTACTRDGLICRAEDQAPDRMCGDYSVRFLCRFMGKKTKEEEETENLFPEFDARIYLVLAIVPVLIFIVRLAWAFIFRQRRRQRRRHRREQRRRRGEAREGEEAPEDGDDTSSINSDLARPPPSYQDLFRDGTPSGVFTISGGNLSPCPKCKDAQCNVVKGLGTRTQQDQSSLQSPSPASSPSSSSLTNSSQDSSTESSTSSHSSPQEQPPGDILMETLGSSVVEIVNETSEETSSQNQPESNDSTDSSSSGESVSVSIPTDSSVPADVPSPCACACHRTVPLSGRGVTGYDNPGFTPDANSASPSSGTAPYRGRHISAIPRNVSDISVLSQITLSELPSYEDALKLEKKLAKEAENS